ncbi:MAG: BlaI/MecI/CopY family transcriptional regulator [Rikenellaceae bacterium]|jgi:predicted transcriptional regulator|nr:BlaI/MecI/CopY family transcriptional regulator [Rikenellaceae bacterium]
MKHRRHSEPRQELTRAELEVMQILWRKEKAFVSDILDEMAEPKPAYNTVSTIVRILEKKGVVSYEAFGKSHRYYPLISREEYTQTLMQNVVGNFFDHSVTQMFSFLAERENLSTREIEEIVAIAKQAIESKK